MAISNKMFYIEKMYFCLPDDFNGTLGDALKLLTDYRLEFEKLGKSSRIDEDKTFDAFFANDNEKCSITYSFSKLNENNEWEHFHKTGNKEIL